MGLVANRREVLSSLDALARRGHRAAAGVSRAVAEDVQLTTRALLTQRSHPLGTKTPSPRGEPPAMISGRLARSVRVGSVARSAEGYAWARVGPTGLPYGRIHELGGMAGRGRRTRIPRRPFLAPGWRLARPMVGRTVRDVWGSTR